MRIRWTQPASRDLTQICDYLSKEDSQATARRIAILIHERIYTLAEFPELGRPGRKAGTRELIVTGGLIWQYIVFKARRSKSCAFFTARKSGRDQGDREISALTVLY